MAICPKCGGEMDDDGKVMCWDCVREEVEAADSDFDPEAVAAYYDDTDDDDGE